MNYSDIETFVSAGLAARGYNPVPVLNPGPHTDTGLLKKSSGAMVFLTVGGGPGFTTEELYDRVFILVHAIGNQWDYAGAEKLADDLDRILVAVDHNTLVGTALTLYITRVGGRPELNDFDAANRYHFQCSYVAETKTGL